MLMEESEVGFVMTQEFETKEEYDAAVRSRRLPVQEVAEEEQS